MSQVPHDVAVARGIRALRAALAIVVAGTLALGVLALALVALVPPGSDLLWPGVSVLMVGQLLGLLAAGLAGWALRSVLAGADPAAAVAGLAGRFRTTAIALVVACLTTSLAWALVDAAALVPALVCAAVAAQLAVVLEVLRRTVLTAR